MQCDYLLIVSIFIVVAGCGVHTIFDQPVEVIPPESGSFLGCLGQISAICVEVPQNHDVLYRYIYKNVSTIFFLEQFWHWMLIGQIQYNTVTATLGLHMSRLNLTE